MDQETKASLCTTQYTILPPTWRGYYGYLLQKGACSELLQIQVTAYRALKSQTQCKENITRFCHAKT